MLDSVFIFAAFFVLAFFLGRWFARLKKKPNLLNVAENTTPLVAAPVMRRVLAIDGTQKGFENYPWLKSWGIAPSEVRDVATVKGPCLAAALPAAAAKCLAQCFGQGTVRGLGASRVMAGDAIEDGQALYFVLTESTAGVPKLTALVG